MMKEQIQILKGSLVQCETKWNRVVNSIVKENVELKAAEEYYKKKYLMLVDKINQKRNKPSQERIKSQSSQHKIPSKKDVLQNS
jgi:hypothetical protein